MSRELLTDVASLTAAAELEWLDGWADGTRRARDPEHRAYQGYGVGQWPVERVLFPDPPLLTTAARLA